ncbi:IgGFc-binding protein-like [Haliotis rufescens]|uniref:IgGFc-binding protein-like n=1 Tax=Haliotis rufescens TaxID=6454 RepID=UPI00201F7E7F|nr:IgGFc-binding protein-like [Haliotis rufescens]
MLPGEEGPFPGELLISITRKQQDAGTIHHHAGTTSTPFNVTRQRGYRWTVTQENPLSRHARSTNSLSVTTGQFVTVMAVSSSLGPTDGYLAIAVNKWGKEYYVITHDEGRSQVAITASEAVTSVLVTLPPGCVLVMDEVEVMAPEYVNVTLDQFEVLLLQADTDLTGTYIQADKPVGVVSGNRFIGERTHLVEQPLPIKTWGRNFVSAPNFDSHWGPVDTYRIISRTNISVGVREVSEGTHYLDGSGNHAVYLSGAGNGSASYCYPAGMGVDTINSKNLSTYKRKHTSAPDARVSARALGTFGVVIIISAVCILIAIDLPVLCHDVINLAPSKRPRMDRRIR